MRCPRRRRALAQPVSDGRTVSFFLTSTVTAVHLPSESVSLGSSSVPRPVLLLVPGVHSGPRKTWSGTHLRDVNAERRPVVPLGRPGDAREAAAVIAFLAGPDAAYVTGASWAVDGGMPRMGPQTNSHLPDDVWRRP